MDWERCEQIGYGADATVYMATSDSEDSSLPIIMAVKSVKVSETKKYDAMVNESKILTLLKGSPFILDSYGTEITTENLDGSDSRYFNLLLDYSTSGCLNDHIKRYGCLQEERVKRYTHCILQGLQHIHDHGYVHGDLHPGNILLFGYSVKIADFGHARRVGATRTPRLVGALRYMAPESVISYEYEPPCDIWTMGCVVLRMITGLHPWYDVFTKDELKERIACTKDIPEIPDKMSLQAQDFLQKCLVRDQNDRWTVEKLLAHPFLLDAKTSSSSSRCSAVKRGNATSSTQAGKRRKKGQ